MQRGNRFGLQRIQDGRTSRDRPGVPVFEHPPGGKHHGIGRVRDFIRGHQLGRHKLAATRWGGEAGGEHDLGAGAVVIARIGDGFLPFEALPADPADGVHGLAQFFIDILWPVIGPAKVKTVGEVLDDRPVLTRQARRVKRGATHLHLTVGIGYRSGLLGPCRGGQDDVCVEGRLGQENLLHHEMVQGGETLPGMVLIRIGHGGIFPHHIHRPDVPLAGRIHDFDHRQSRIRVQIFDLPELFEPRAGGGIGDALIVRENHRDQARIRRALDVILAPKRVQACARAPDLTGHQRQRDQATGIVGAVDALGYSHAPEDDRAFRSGVNPRDGADGFGINAADSGHGLRREVSQGIPQRVIPLGVAGDVLRIDEVFFDDGVHHRVEQRDVRARLELQEVVRVPGQGVTARVHQDQLGTAFGRRFQEGGGDRVIFGRPGTNNDDAVAVFGRRERCCDRA